MEKKLEEKINKKNINKIDKLQNNNCITLNKKKMKLNFKIKYIVFVSAIYLFCLDF